MLRATGLGHERCSSLVGAWGKGWDHKPRLERHFPLRPHMRAQARIVRDGNIVANSIEIEGLAHFTGRKCGAAEESAIVSQKTVIGISFSLPPTYQRGG